MKNPLKTMIAARRGLLPQLPSSPRAPSPAILTAPARHSPIRSTPCGRDAYKKKTGIGLNYQSIGSGGGIAQIKAKTVISALPICR